MLFLKILLGVFLFFAFILMLKATVILTCGDEVTLSVSVLGFIRIRLLPKKEKRVRLRDYSKKKVAKRLEKERKKKELRKEKKAKKKQEKAKRRQAKKNISHAEKNRKPNLSENLDMIKDILSMFLSRFFKHFRIKVARMHIRLATGDAASTAILYGAVCQAVRPVIALLERFTNINDLNKADIDISPDFVGESTSVDIKISFSLRVWHVLDIGVRALKRFIKTRIAAQKRAARTEARAEAIRKRIEAREKSKALKQK